MQYRKVRRKLLLWRLSRAVHNKVGSYRQIKDIVLFVSLYLGSTARDAAASGRALNSGRACA